MCDTFHFFVEKNGTDEDPPFVAGAFENGCDQSLADVRGRFWYVQLKKRF